MLRCARAIETQHISMSGVRMSREDGDEPQAPVAGLGQRAVGEQVPQPDLPALRVGEDIGRASHLTRGQRRDG